VTPAAANKGPDNDADSVMHLDLPDVEPPVYLIWYRLGVDPCPLDFISARYDLLSHRTDQGGSVCLLVVPNKADAAAALYHDLEQRFQ
jgi:hypothetical protein